MPLLHHHYTQNTEIADYYFFSNGLIPYKCRNHSSIRTVDQGLRTVEGDGNKQSSFLPTAQAGTWLPGNVTSKEILPLSKSPPCPQLIKATKKRQPMSHFVGPSLLLCCLPPSQA